MRLILSKDEYEEFLASPKQKGFEEKKGDGHWHTPVIFDLNNPDRQRLYDTTVTTCEYYMMPGETDPHGHKNESAHIYLAVKDNGLKD